MKNELISVIVPVYNVEKYLNKCIQSIVSQTYKNLEIILVDDGSPDNCPKMCDDWAAADSRIKVIHKQNGGLSSARNAALDIAVGDYLFFIDSDDYAEPDMVEFLHSLIISGEYDVARCGAFIDDLINNKSLQIGDGKRSVPSFDDSINNLMNGGNLSGVVWNKMYKTNAVKGIRFDPADGCSEDIMYNFRVLTQTDRVICCDEPKYHYVLRNDSITNSHFTEGAFCILRAKRIITDSQRDNLITFPYCVKGYIQSSFIVLSGIISNQQFLDRFDSIRGDILRHKREIFFSGKYSRLDKIKTLLLWLAPKLYCRCIIKRKK